MAYTEASGSLTSATSSAGFERFGEFLFTIDGTFVGTVQLQGRPLAPASATWVPVSADGSTAALFTAPCAVIVTAPEQGFEYRVTCTAFTSGTINWRMGGAAARRAFA